MASTFRIWRRQKLDLEVIERGVQVALKPPSLAQQPGKLRKQVEEVAKALTSAPQMQAVSPRQGVRNAPQPISARDVAMRAATTLSPTSSVTPADIELALHRQGLDWVEPFAPGRPLAPYYGYNRRPRQYNYKVGRNISTDTRPDRIPFITLAQVIESYDIAMTCIRHIISDIRSMPVVWGPIDGYTGDVSKEIVQGKKFWERPDGKRHFNTWLSMLQMDVLRYDAGCLYRERNRAGKLLALKIIDGTTIAPMRDYFGEIPFPPAPAYQQFIQGVPWNWLTTDDIIYEPMWPIPESPYGVPPIETVLINANTDMRLQLFFLQFFTSGAVSEMLLEAPPDQSDPDALADFQELWDDWMDGNQAKRHGARWIPSGSKPFPYKQIDQINPKIAEYVMRRTVAAFQLTPQDLGILDDVNRATSDTQMDTQFRISTLPNTEYYESIINAVTQEDLQLPIAMHFDTGRETEDRLTEAQAHQVYVSIGAESPDEVREKVLGYKIDAKSRVPRFFDSPKLGPIPIGYLIASSGKIDQETLAPIDVDIAAQPFVPAYGIHEAITPNQEVGAAPRGNRPLRIDEDIHDQAEMHTGSTRAKAPVSTSAPDSPKPAGTVSPRSGEAPGYGVPKKVSKATDLAKWRKQSIERLRKGQKPREFADSAIDTKTYDYIWDRLQKSTSIADVDAAFSKNLEPPTMAGLALRAADTGRVLMLQRAKLENEGDPVAGCWEFPGGHVEEGEDLRGAAIREWEEEVGLPLPAGARKIAEWLSTNGVYQGFVLEIPNENDVDLLARDASSNPDTDTFESVAWWEPSALSSNAWMRGEVKANSQIIQDAIVPKFNEPLAIKANDDPKVVAPVPGAISNSR